MHATDFARHATPTHNLTSKSCCDKNSVIFHQATSRHVDDTLLGHPILFSAVNELTFGCYSQKNSNRLWQVVTLKRPPTTLIELPLVYAHT